MILFPVSRFTVSGNSMLPTLKPGQEVISFNWAYLGRKPKIGDVVVVKQDGKDLIKRVQKVDGRRIFIKGDNNNQSTDSRHFGPVKLDQIIGKIIYSSNKIT